MMSKLVRVLLTSFVALSFLGAFAQEQEPTVSFTLRGGLGSQGFEFMGVGGDIDAVRNPDLNVKVGDVVEVILINGDASGMVHDFVIPDLEVASAKARVQNESVRVVFTVTAAGTFTYLCSEPGHALPEANFGMFGKLIVSD